MVAHLNDDHYTVMNVSQGDEERVADQIINVHRLNLKRAEEGLTFVKSTRQNEMHEANTSRIHSAPSHWASIWRQRGQSVE